MGDKSIIKEKDKELKKRVKRKVPNQGTIFKLILESFVDDPAIYLDLSPNLYQILNEFEINKKRTIGSYFANYVTERELADFVSQIKLIINRNELSKDESIKLIELISAVGIGYDKTFRSEILKAIRILGSNPDEIKDSNRVIRRGQLAGQNEIIRGVRLGFDWGGSLLEIAIFGKDNQIRKSAESLIGSISISSENYNIDSFEEISPGKTVIIDKSAILSILNKKASNHYQISHEFLKLIDNRCIIVCPFEVLLSLITELSSISVNNEFDNIIKNTMNVMRIVWSLSSAKKMIIKMAFLNEFKGLESSDYYAILLSSMSSLPLFTSNKRVKVAFDKIKNHEILKK